jgi:GxxExxY protein
MILQLLAERSFEQEGKKGSEIMDSKFERANAWSNVVIGSAIEVHRLRGPGLLESIYDKCLGRELQIRDVPAISQVAVEIEYKGIKFSDSLKVDLYVDDCLLVELKAVERILPIHKAQLFSYMKLLAAPIGLLINFHEVTLRKGIHRMILPGTQP